MLLPEGAGFGASIPGSRNGRGVLPTTTLKMPLLLPVALGSLVLPPVGATTRKLAAVTRMPSKGSS
jgi:hypothetical protein